MSVKRPGPFKDIEVPSLDGLFDCRTPSGQVGFGNYRIVLNMDATKEKSRCRLGGWTKFGADSPHGFKNQDFHDQMLDCLTYRDSFEHSAFIPAGLSGYDYPYWTPAYTGDAYAVDDTPLGPFYGYAPDFYDYYPTTPGPNQWFLCNVFIGTPYAPTEEIFWDPNNNVPELTVPNGSAPPIGEVDHWHYFTSPTKKSVNNFASPGKAPGVDINHNPSDTLNDALITWWKSVAYDSLVSERAGLAPPMTVTAVKFYWAWIAGSPSSGWNIENLYADNTDFSDYSSAGWTLAIKYTEAETGTPAAGISGTVSSGGTQGYFSLCRFQIQQAQYDAYGSGTLQPSYHSAYGYTYSYCGDYVYNRAACREVITMLHESSSVAGRRKFLVGTKSKLAVLNERGGNYRILADGLGGPYSDARNCGCPSARFKVAQLGNVVVFTNDIDPVLFWVMDSGPAGCDDWSVDYIQDLLALNITRAKVVASWRGFVFVMNVEQEGERHSNRIFWCDYNTPLGWIPGANSLAATTDLADGDRIVAAETIGQQLRIYTRRGANQTAIYDVMLVGGETTLNFQEVYRGPDGLQYENSMVNCGDVHYWVSESGIMELGPYDRTPNRMEWIHRASAALYDGIQGEWLGPLKPFAMEFTSEWLMTTGFAAVNKSACDMVNGFYDSHNKALWFSWPTGDAECPDMSLRLNLQYRSASLVDHGFTAGCMMRPDYAGTLRDFLVEFAGCEPASLMVSKEGLPYSFPTPITPPTSIRNATEDPDLPVDPNSMCALLGDKVIDELCAACDADSMLVMADAQDRTLKQFTPSTYYRERYVGGEQAYDCPYTSPGIYAQDGYFSLIQSDADDYKQKVEKIINRAEIDFVAEDQVAPNELSFEVAYGAQPRCLTWDQSATPKELTCLTSESAVAHAANNTRPSEMATYNFYRRGVFIAWRAFTSGTGGASCWNRVTTNMRLAAGEWR